MSEKAQNSANNSPKAQNKTSKVRLLAFAFSLRLRKLFKNGSGRIYADYAAVTPTDPKVLKTYIKAAKLYKANPSSLHADGVRAKNALETARTEIAETLFAHPDEIVFCGSGTEANNMAILSTVEGLIKDKEKSNGFNYSDLHIIVSEIEHVSILGPVRMLEEKGVHVTYTPVLPNGQIDLEVLEKSITPQTILISVMAVNNEIGTCQPLVDIAKIVRKEKKKRREKREATASNLPLYFHTDASQAFLYQEIDTRKMGVDLITLDSHKVYGPRGAGLLWVRRTLVPVLQKTPVVVGGRQENGLRAATEAVPTIVAFAHAMCLAKKRREKDLKHVERLREIFISEIGKTLPAGTFHINCSSATSTTTAPHIISVSFPGRDHEELLFRLDAASISASTKSSCQSDEDESYVLRAVGILGVHGGALRFSFGRWSTTKEVYKIVRALSHILHSTY